MTAKTVEQLSDHVFLIRDDIFPLYIVKGEKNFLIDSGASVKAPQFEKNIRDFLQGESLHTLLLTHTHWDHTGASSYLQDRFEFDVTASRRGVELLDKEKVTVFIDRMNRDAAKLAPDLTAVPYTGLKRLSVVSEGDVIEAENSVRFRVFETPGHTKCSVSYLLEPDMILFPGDALGVMEKNGIVRALFLSSFQSHESSILKLMATPAEILAFPHNRPVRGRERVQERMEKVLVRGREIRDKIVSLLNESSDIPAIAGKFLDDEFKTPTIMGPPEAFRINLEAMVATVLREKTAFSS
jgi:glyoxylase-like metal-dependent hydrolase (beta-lactamase superfamily II)